MDYTVVEKYFKNLSTKQLHQFEQLGSLYKLWNEQINVISRKDIDELYIRHVLHSLSIAKFINFKDGTNIVDIGTGGGFPGIPLAILFPNCNFTLVDSIGKKIKVVNEVSKSIGITNVTAVNERVENLKFPPHFYITRAVAKSEELLMWINKKISKDQFNDLPNGLIALKGGDLSDELKNINNFKQTPISCYFDEEFFNEKFLIHIKI